MYRMEPCIPLCSHCSSRRASSSSCTARAMPQWSNPRAAAACLIKAVFFSVGVIPAASYESCNYFVSFPDYQKNHTFAPVFCHYIPSYMQIKMKVMILAGCLLTLLGTAQLGTAQEKNKIKFGRISPEDFQKTSYDLDTGAHAVVLADIGFSEFEAEQAGFKLGYKT